MKHIALIKFDDSDNPWMVYKDVGMLLYKLAQKHNWKSTYLYFDTTFCTRNWSPAFTAYVDPVCMGKAIEFKEQLKLAKKYIKEHAKEIDVLMFFNYGSTIWKLARLAKKFNPHIIVYSKLDMGIGGYTHFVNHRFGISLKNQFEKLKSSYVDWFTVETKEYYEGLKKTSVFKDRIGYLPNGVSLLDTDITQIESHPKENIVLTSGRLGEYVKNNELLVDAITKIPESVISSWKFYFVGPYTSQFEQYINHVKAQYPPLKNKIFLTGSIMDRNRLYSLYRRAKIICMTSRTEGACIAAIEAMYFGAYPIITRYSSFAMDTTNNENCGIIIPSDAEVIAKILTSKMEDTLLNTYAIKCQTYARRMFNYEILADRLDKQLRKLVNKSGQI